MPIDNNGQSVQNNSQPPFVWQNSQILQQNKSNNFLIFVQQNNKTSTTNQQQQTVSEMLQNLKDVKLDTKDTGLLWWEQVLGCPSGQRVPFHPVGLASGASSPDGRGLLFSGTWN